MPCYPLHRSFWALAEIAAYYRGSEQEMKDQDMTKVKLLEKIVVLRQRNTELEASETDRKQAEKALRESEGKLTAMLQAIGDHMSMMDKDLNIIWAYEVARRVFGNGIVGKNVTRHTIKETPRRGICPEGNRRAPQNDPNIVSCTPPNEVLCEGLMDG